MDIKAEISTQVQIQEQGHCRAQQGRVLSVFAGRDSLKSMRVFATVCVLYGGLTGPQLAATAAFSTTHASRETLTAF